MENRPFRAGAPLTEGLPRVTRVLVLLLVLVLTLLPALSYFDQHSDSVLRKVFFIEKEKL